MTEKPKTKVDELRDALQKRKSAEDADVNSDDVTIEENSLEAELATAREEAKQHYDKLLRVMADFDNFRRRNDKEKKDAIKFANEELISELLTVLDHMDQALSHIKQSDSAEAKNLALGVELVCKQLVSTFEKYGLKAIDAVGQPFDAKVHEALQMVDAEDVAPGTVVVQHRRGYLLGERLLRPALVDVAREH